MPSSILILEDDALQACYLEEVISDLGYAVLGPFRELSDAEQQLDLHVPTAALLDHEIGKGTSVSLQETLVRRGVPFAILTGNLATVGAAAEDTHGMVIPKPCDAVGLGLAIRALIDTRFHELGGAQ